MTTARRFGRIIKSGDILFGDADYPCTVSVGGIRLTRQGTDDYVRVPRPRYQLPSTTGAEQPAG